MGRLFVSSQLILAALPLQAAEVDFSKDVLPILQAKCSRCHVGNEPKGGLTLESRASLLKGGDSGEVVKIGAGGRSLLIELVSGNDESRIMPPQGGRLTGKQIATLKQWIDMGLAWPDGVSVRSAKTADVAPRMPDVPPADPASGLTNPIDRILATHYRAEGIDPRHVVSNRIFARRTSLDLIGLLPSPDEIAALEKDPRPDKRQRYVRKLLDEKVAYADHWLTFWNDALRNAYRGTGFIDDGRRQITGWLYDALYSNKPYRQFVHELISPVDGSEGFTKGLVWRGVVNASQRTEMQAAQTISQVFLGVNLKCASCHDSFINQWKLADSYALANVFADKPLEIHRCNKPTGEQAGVGFLYPQLGTIDPSLPKARRMERLADLVTSDENGRLNRTIANRLWAVFLGHGIVEPVDEMDNLPWNGPLLDLLGSELARHDDDLQELMFLICTSRAYQLPSVGMPPSNSEAEYVFRGPVVKRMTAEQFADAVSTLTNAWPDAGPAAWKRDGRGQNGQLAARQAVLQKHQSQKNEPAAKPEAKWIWSHANALQDPGGSAYFRKSFVLDEVPEKAVVVATCDNEFVLFVNGTRAGVGRNWNQPETIDIRKYLHTGPNLIAVRGINYPDPSSKRGLDVKGANPGGLIAVVTAYNDDSPVWTIGSDKSWLCSQNPQAGWQRPDRDVKGWRHASELGDAAMAPWNIAAKLTPASAGSVEHLRASLTDADPLLRALGQPNREQVVTRRDSLATTLQALELTNGDTLDRKLKAGGEYWLQTIPDDSNRLIEQLFQIGLNRAPTAGERAVAKELLGTPPDAQGVEDLLWSIVMLGEFQLIY